MEPKTEKSNRISIPIHLNFSGVVLTLACANKGYKGCIIDLTGPKEIVQRLIELGIVPGQKVCFVNSSFWGEPIIVEIRNTKIALRKVEAECIQL